ncbi:MAG: LysR family transcriptional regulator [Devosiaceae bacterium]|nr:LysR family transcriptional regulator [Devosiaceae bacterium]
MQIQSLKIFVAVAQCGNFAEVARLYNKDASSISRAIGSLESQLNTKLFSRTTRKVELTAAGEMFFDRVEPLLLGFDEAANLVNSGKSMEEDRSAPKGHIRLFTSAAMGQKIIVPLLAKFKKSFPSLSIELVLGEGNVDFMEEKFDLAISSNQNSASEFISQKLAVSNSIICASPNYLKDCPPLRSPQNLDQHKCLQQPSTWLQTEWKFFSRLGDASEQAQQLVAPTGEVFIANDLARLEACAAGLGPALFEDWLVKEQIESGELVNVFPFHRVTSGEVEGDIWLIFSRKKFLPEKTRLAIEFFKHHLEDEKK